MGRQRKEEDINPFLVQVLKNNPEYLTKDGKVSIKKFAEKTGLHFNSVVRIASPTYTNDALLLHLTLAEALNVPLDQWVQGITGNTKTASGK